MNQSGLRLHHQKHPAEFETAPLISASPCNCLHFAAKGCRTCRATPIMRSRMLFPPPDRTSSVRKHKLLQWLRQTKKRKLVCFFFLSNSIHASRSMGNVLHWAFIGSGFFSPCKMKSFSLFLPLTSVIYILPLSRAATVTKH